MRKQMNVSSLPREAREQITEVLWNPINITLYRQQALRWVAAAAKKQRLSLAIYGLAHRALAAALPRAPALAEPIAESASEA